jgi:hypothetical protein
MRAVYLLAPALVPALLGCSANVAGSPEAGDAEVGASAAVVVVERTATAGDTRASAVARFLRMHSGAVDEEALRLVGAAVDFPAQGSCSALPAAKVAARAVELMNVGAVALEVGGVRTSLEPRLLPDVVDLVSGVVYATRISDADGLPADSTYLLRAAGAPEVDLPSFAVVATAPGEPVDLRVQGQDAHGPVALTAGVPVDLTWTAGGADDLVYVDVNGSPETSGPGVRCLFADSGHASLANAADAWADGTLLVHRLHRETFRVRGIDAGEIRFDFARAVSFARR